MKEFKNINNENNKNINNENINSNDIFEDTPKPFNFNEFMEFVSLKIDNSNIEIKLYFLWAFMYIFSGIYIRMGQSQILFVGCLLFVFTSVCYFIKKKKYKFIVSVTMMFIFSFINSNHMYNTVLLSDDEKFTSQWSGIIFDINNSNMEYQKIYIETYTQKGEKLIIYGILGENESFTVGDKIEFTGELKEFSLPSSESGFNEKLYYSSKGINYKMFPKDIVKIGENKDFYYYRNQLREKIFFIIDDLYPELHSGIIKAIITGIKDYIPSEIIEVFNYAGISHILCISGLHISILVFWVGLVLKKILKLNRKLIKIVIFILTLLLLFFIGITPSIIRVSTIVFFSLIATLVHRKTIWLNSLAGGACFMLLIRPLYLFDISFQLSFITSFGIMLCSDILIGDDKLSEIKIIDEMKKAFLICVYAFLFSVPIIAYYFENINIFSIILNFMLMPFFSTLVISAILSCVFYYIAMPIAIILSFIARISLIIIDYVTLYSNDIIEVIINVGSKPLYVICLYYALIICITNYGEKYCKKTTVITLAVALVFTNYSNELFIKKNTIAFLDVGQGDSTVITSYNNKAIIIDGGGVYGRDYGSNVGVSVVKPYLDSLGIKEVESVFITHFERDHVLGIIEICQTMPVNSIYISQYPFEKLNYWEVLRDIANEKNIPIHMLGAGDYLVSEEFGTIECLAPQEGVYYLDNDDNHGSLILKYTYNDYSVLLTGDATKEDENILLNLGYDIDVDLLKLGHHGSGGSSSERFIEAVNAPIGIISCGKDNIYNHPHEDVLNVTEHMDIYRTDTMGTILIDIYNSGKHKIRLLEQGKPIYERVKSKVEK